MKLSLDAVSYSGYFYEGGSLTFEETIDKADAMGYDAVDLFPHRPMGFPMDLSSERRKRIKAHAETRGIELAVIEACTNFMMTDHILTQTQDKELLFVRECCSLARDLGFPVVRVLAGYVGYFMHPEAPLGYTNTAMWGRNVDVSQELDYLRQWEYARTGLAEAARIAEDHGVELALQNHPPLTNNTRDTLEMIAEIDHPNLKIGLDLPLFERQDDEFVRNTVLSTRGLMIHSHALGMRPRETLQGVVGIEEVVPGEGRENWPVFFAACKEIGYDAYLAYEQCSPIFVKGHKRASIDEVDRRAKQGLVALRRLMDEQDVYTGNREIPGDVLEAVSPTA